MLNFMIHFVQILDHSLLHLVRSQRFRTIVDLTLGVKCNLRLRVCLACTRLLENLCVEEQQEDLQVMIKA